MLSKISRVPAAWLCRIVSLLDNVRVWIICHWLDTEGLGDKVAQKFSVLLMTYDL
jgi:hypothetical protein